MSRIRPAFAAFAAAALLPACSDAPGLVEPEPRVFLEPLYEVEVEPDIVFGTGDVRLPAPGQKELLLDLYRPAATEAPAIRPGVVLVHGGGFARGSRTDGSMVELGRRLAARGYVAISIEYRLTGDDPPAEALATDPGDPLKVAAAAARVDAALAVEWLRDHAADYGVDPDRVAIAGYSAGAITALGVAYWDAGVQRADVRAVFSLSGGLHGSEGMIDAGEPPMLLVHGALDTARPYHLALAARADDVGLTYDMHELAGYDHGDMARAFDTSLGSETVWEVVADFLYDHLDLATLS